MTRRPRSIPNPGRQENVSRKIEPLLLNVPHAFIVWLAPAVNVERPAAPASTLTALASPEKVALRKARSDCARRLEILPTERSSKSEQVHELCEGAEEAPKAERKDDP